MQPVLAADDLSASRQLLSIGEHDPVLASRPGAVTIECGDREPVIVGPVAAEERHPGLRYRQGLGALDVVMPAGHTIAADEHHREIGVVAGPGAVAVDIKRVAVVDGTHGGFSRYTG